MKASIIFFFVSIATVGFSQSKANAVQPTPQAAAFQENDDVLVAPSFIGGEQELTMFVMHNLYYPNLAKQRGVEGTVLVSFEVLENGSIQDIKVEKSLGSGCDKAALQVIKNMPYWNPATINGEPTIQRVQMPIQFKM